MSLKKIDFLPSLNHITSWITWFRTNRVRVKCHAILEIENAGINFKINVKKTLNQFTWLSLHPSNFKRILSGDSVSLFSKTIFMKESHNSIQKKSHRQADMHKPMYLSMLLQRLHRTDNKRPQRVVGQNDEQIYCFPILCGPCDGKGAVCASTWDLEHTMG